MCQERTKEDENMKKKAMVLFLVLLLLVLGSCRKNGAETGTDSGNTDTSDGAEASSDDESETDGATDTVVDVNADEAAFVQTGEHDESVKLVGTGGAEPAMIVVDLGDLVTLEIFSERVQTTEIYNEDLLVDVTVGRGQTTTVTIEANEEGFFDVIDKTTGEQLFKFAVAGESFG